MGYYLEHKHKASRRVSAISFTQCQSDYYSQLRNDDGSIPWRMMYQASPKHEAVELDPQTGDVMA